MHMILEIAAAPGIGRPSQIQALVLDRVASAATAASSAGRIGAATRLRTRQRAPQKLRFATEAKPCSSARSASSRCAMRSPDGSARAAGTRASTRTQ